METQIDVTFCYIGDTPNLPHLSGLKSILQGTFIELWQSGSQSWTVDKFDKTINFAGFENDYLSWCSWQ